jgi:hypothetical protein
MRVRREEMAQVVSDVKNRIKSDICSKMQNFFASHNKTVEEFSHFTQADSRDVRNVLNGNANISLDSFIKMMVATGNAIEVRSLVPPHMMRQNVCENNFNHCQHTNHCNVNNCNEEVEDDFEDEDDEIIDECSFSEMELHTKTREELVDLVFEMGWETEIDMCRATRSALINFLSSKQRELDEEFEDGCGEMPNCENDSDTERIMQKMQSLFTNNPQLRENFVRLFGL